MTRSILVLVTLLGGGCHGDPATPPTPPTPATPPASRPAVAATAPVDAAPAPIHVDQSTVEGLWTGYRALHLAATHGDAVAIGTQIDALLSDDARTALQGVSAATSAKLAPNVRLDPAQVRFNMLGESAVLRRALVEHAGAPAISYPTPDHAVLAVKGDKGKLDLEAVKENGRWALSFTADLLPSDAEMFPSTSRPAAAAAGGTSVEDLANRWVAVLNTGSGWDAYNLFDRASKARLLQMVSQMGGTGEEDVARVMEKTVRDRQNRGLKATVNAVTPVDADHGGFTVNYSNGSSDDFKALRENGAWWVVAPM